MMALVLLSSWIIFTLVALIRVKRFEHEQANEGWNWHRLVVIFSLLQTLNVLVNYTDWMSVILRDSGTLGFVRVVTLVTSRAVFYVLLQLGGVNWGGLRKRLLRVEWRTILGGTLFATLADLVYATEKMEVRDVVPMVAVQVLVLAVVGWRGIRQLAQIAVFRENVCDDEEKYERYCRFWYYHWGALLFHVILMGGMIAQLALAVSGEVKPETVILYGQQGVLLFSCIFWISCLFLNLLQ